MALTKIKTSGIADNAITNAKMADDAIDSADLAAGSIDNAHLAGSIAVSKTLLAGGTGLTLSTNTLAVDAAQTQITSVGTLTSLTTSGNIGLGATLDTWHSSYDALQGANFSLSTDASAGASKSVTLAYNQYIDSGNAWTYINADEASYYQQYNGAHYFATAGAGSADGDVTNSTKLTIANDGNATFAGNLTINGSQLYYYKATNSGNPEYHQGSSATNQLHLQTVYDSSAQTLNYVAFSTYSTNASADKGAIYFNIDETERLKIGDSGLSVGGEIDCRTSLDVQESDGTDPARIKNTSGDVSLQTHGTNTNWTWYRSANHGGETAGNTMFSMSSNANTVNVGSASCATSLYVSGQIEQHSIHGTHPFLKLQVDHHSSNTGTYKTIVGMKGNITNYGSEDLYSQIEFYNVKQSVEQKVMSISPHGRFQVGGSSTDANMDVLGLSKGDDGGVGAIQVGQSCNKTILWNEHWNTGTGGTADNIGYNPIIKVNVACDQGETSTSSSATNDRAWQIGLNLENNAVNHTYAPFITWSRLSASGSYNSIFAAIGAQRTGSGGDTNWNIGDLIFYTQYNPGGASDPREAMRIASSGNVTGTHGSYHTSSDETLKKNISTITGALDKVNEMRGVKFKWKVDDDPYLDEHRNHQRVNLGFIAQELEQVIPEVVNEGEPNLNGDTLKSIQDSNQITAVLVEAIKELSAKVTALENA